MQQNDIAAIEKKLHYQFRDKKLLQQAFTHRSYINEHREETSVQNERLEFLGDAVLGLIVSTYLYEILPDIEEGELSFIRSNLVDGQRCVAYVQKLGLGEYLLLGRGEQMNVGKGREGLLADLFEALLGAIYLDGGLESAKTFLFRHFTSEMEEAMQAPQRNWKAELQDYTQKNLGAQPKYEVENEEGPDHEKFFTIGVYCNEKKYGEGSGCSKKQAAQNAAQNALEKLQQ